MKATAARIVKRPTHSLLVVTTDHKVPRFLVNEYRYHRSGKVRVHGEVVDLEQHARDLVSRGVKLSPMNWMEIDPVEFAMRGNVKTVKADVVVEPKAIEA